MSEIKTSMGAEVDTALNDLLVTTESLGYQKGCHATIQRVCTLMDGLITTLEESHENEAAAGLRVALKAIGGIYVVKPDTH
jgi:hypothetical protein